MRDYKLILARSVLWALILLGADVSPLSAGEYRTSVFPAQDIFRRILADPRAAQTSARFYSSNGRNALDGGIGNSWGIVRWERPKNPKGWRYQLNLEAVAYSRFLLFNSVTSVNQFQAMDALLNIPLQIRRRDFSARVSLFHESSHLGDDYFRKTGQVGFRYSIDGLRGLLSYDFGKQVRIYGGGFILYNSVPANQEGAAQAGFELISKDLRWFDKSHYESWFYLAQDFQWSGRVGWNMSSRTELGMRLGVPRVMRAVRVFTGYTGGSSAFGQFYTSKDHYWDFGVAFDFS